MSTQIQVRETISSLCMSFPECEKYHLESLRALPLEKLIYEFKPVLVDPATAGKALNVLSELCSQYDNMTDKQVLLLIEFFSAKICYATLRFDALSSLSHFIQAINETFESSPSMFQVLIDTFLNKVNVQQLRMEYRKSCFIILQFMINDATIHVCSVETLEKILHAIDGESNPELVLVSFNIHLTIYNVLDKTRFAQLLEEMFESVATYFPVVYNQPPNCNVTRNDLRCALHKCLAHPIYEDIAIPFLLNKASMSYSNNAKSDVFTVILECCETYSWKMIHPYIHEVIQIVKNEIIKVSSQIVIANDVKHMEQTLRLAYSVLEHISEIASANEVNLLEEEITVSSQTVFDVIIEGIVECINKDEIIKCNVNVTANSTGHKQGREENNNRIGGESAKLEAEKLESPNSSATIIAKAYATMIYHICLGGERSCVAFSQKILLIITNKFEESEKQRVNNNIVIMLSALMCSICASFDRHHDSSDEEELLYRRQHCHEQNEFNWTCLRSCLQSVWEKLCVNIIRVLWEISSLRCTSDFEVLIRAECISAFLKFATIQISPTLSYAMANKLILTLFSVAINTQSSLVVHEEITDIVLKCEFDYRSIVYACIKSLLHGCQEVADSDKSCVGDYHQMPQNAVFTTSENEVFSSACETEEAIENEDLLLLTIHEEENANAINAPYALQLIVQFLLIDASDERSQENNGEKNTIFILLLSEVLLPPGNTMIKWTEALSVRERVNAAELLLRNTYFLIAEYQLQHFFSNEVMRILSAEYFPVLLLLAHRFEGETCVSYLLKLLTPEVPDQIETNTIGDNNKFPLFFVVAALVVHGKNFITHLVSREVLNIVWRQLILAYITESASETHSHDIIIITGLVQLVYLSLWYKLVYSVKESRESSHLFGWLENMLHQNNVSKDDNIVELESDVGSNEKINKVVADITHISMTNLNDDFNFNITSDDVNSNVITRFDKMQEQVEVLVTLSIVWGIITFSIKEEITEHNHAHLLTALREFRQAKESATLNKVTTFLDENNSIASTFISCLRYVPINLREYTCNNNHKTVTLHTDNFSTNVCTKSNSHLSLRNVNQSRQYVSSTNNQVYYKKELVQSEQTSIQTRMLVDYITVELNEETNTSLYWNGLTSLLTNIEQVDDTKVFAKILHRLQVVNSTSYCEARQILSHLLCNTCFAQLFVATIKNNTYVINAVLQGLSDHRSFNRLQSVELLTKIGNACKIEMNKKSDNTANVQGTSNEFLRNNVFEHDDETSTRELDKIKEFTTIHAKFDDLSDDLNTESMQKNASSANGNLPLVIKVQLK